MARTYKDEIQGRAGWKWHPEAPWWKYNRWLKHGPAEQRRQHNRAERRRNKLRVRMGKDPLKHVRDMPWIWW